MNRVQVVIILSSFDDASFLHHFYPSITVNCIIDVSLVWLYYVNDLYFAF